MKVSFTLYFLSVAARKLVIVCVAHLDFRGQAT